MRHPKTSLPIAPVLLLLSALACAAPGLGGNAQATLDAAVAQTLTAAGNSVSAPPPSLTTDSAALSPTAPLPTPAIPPTLTPFPTPPAPPGRPAFSPENANRLQPVMLSALDETPTALAWSPDSRLVAAGMSSGRVEIVEAVTNARPYAGVDAGMPVSGARWSPDGYVLGFTTGEPGESPRLWDLVTNGPLTTWNARLAGASAVAFSPDRLTVAAGYPDGTATLWNSNTGQVVQTLDVTGVVNAEGIVGLEFSPDGARLATFSGPGEPWVVLWDVQTGDALGTYTPVGLIAGPVAYPIMSPDWRYLAWVSRGTVILIDPGTGLEVERFNHEDFVVGISFTPDSRLLATSSAKTLNGLFSPVVSLWNAENGALILDQPGFESPPLVAFSPDGTLLATAWGTLLETWIIGP